MTLPAYVIDQDTHVTIATFGLEVDVPRGAEVPWLPQRWCLVRTYRLPAYGPGEHSWGAWAGALGMLLATFSLLLWEVLR